MKKCYTYSCVLLMITLFISILTDFDSSIKKDVFFFSANHLSSTDLLSAIDFNGMPSATCSEFAIIAVNYHGNTLLRFDGVTGDFLDTIATAAQGLSQPNFMYQLSNEEILIPNATTDNIVKINPYTGTLDGIFATGLSFPEQIKLGSDDSLYVADQLGNEVIKYGLDGVVGSIFNDANLSNPQGVGFIGTDMYVSNAESGGKINQYHYLTGAFVATLHDYPAGEFPRGLSVDVNGDLFVVVKTPTGTRIEKFDFPAGTRTTFLTMDPGSNPHAGIAWGPDGNLYISDFGENQLQIYDNSGVEVAHSPITIHLDGPHGVAFVGCNPLMVSGAITAVTCPSENDGEIDLSHSGGIKLNIENPANQPYDILWSNGATTEDIAGLVSGPYYVTVTDWNKVAQIDTFVITEPSPACAYDYGDLPDTASGTTSINNYETFDSTNGPHHFIVAGLFLGDTVDVDTDGWPDSLALGDDVKDGYDDEDGLTILPSMTIRPGGTIRLPLKMTNTTGDTAYIEAWIDWNGDGDFADTAEMVADYKDNKDGVFPAFIEIYIPPIALTGSPLGFRIRLSNTDNMTPYGKANTGEVEDYVIGIDCPQVICLPYLNVVKL